MSDSMPTWSEWEHLSPAARDYRLYNVLVEVYGVMADCQEKAQIDSDRISTLERRKLLDRGIAAIVGAATGFVTAIASIFGIKI